MNLNENKRCENFDLDDDTEIFDFYQGFVDEVFEKTLFDGIVESRSKVDPVFDSLMSENELQSMTGEPETEPGVLQGEQAWDEEMSWG